MQTSTLYEGVSATTNNSAVSAAAVTTLYATPSPHRRGIKIANHHASRSLFVYESNSATAPASVTTANAIHVIGAGQTLTLSCGKVYHFVEYDSTGGATTGNVNTTELF